MNAVALCSRVLNRYAGHHQCGRRSFQAVRLVCASGISRREFVEKITAYAVGGVTVAMLLEYLMPKYVVAQQVH